MANYLSNIYGDKSLADIGESLNTNSEGLSYKKVENALFAQIFHEICVNKMFKHFVENKEKQCENYRLTKK